MCVRMYMYILYIHIHTYHNLGNFHVKNIHVINFRGSRVPHENILTRIFSNIFKKMGLVHETIHDELQA